MTTSPPTEAERLALIKRAQAQLPEDAPPVAIASRAIQMRQEETDCSWVELVDSGWTFGGDDVRRILDREGSISSAGPDTSES